MKVDTKFNLTGKLLVAMPQIEDPQFNKAVIYVCGHDANGAMGLVINKVLHSVNFKDLLTQLKIETDPSEEIDIHFGGPIDIGRGFVLHSNDFMIQESILIKDNIVLTATVDILKAIAIGQGPNKHIMALGYSGWAAKQLESEIFSNGWICIDADEEIIFNKHSNNMWEHSLEKIGVNPSMLSSISGHA